ncbi:hypothetical protein NQZ79_g1047 [Umbelopsis isabellina]|nr:hypothetical protein NQZ79_g1047 [Umbelopsis isabellina]
MPTQPRDDSDNKVAAANRVKSLVDGIKLPLQGDWQVDIDYYHIDDLPNHLRDWSFQTFKENMLTMYTNSNDGWDAEQKKNEMFAKEARYLIARSRQNPAELHGMLLFQMVQEETMDDDVLCNVAYCLLKRSSSYEIQLKESARGKGLGEYLMKLLEEIGNRWEMEKVMLTVFKDILLIRTPNRFELDEISPGACLPARKARLFDYEILCKKI